jgi:glucosamine-6-phosphate deaminase
LLPRAEAEQTVASEIAAVVRSREAEGRPCALGLAAGTSPVGVYRELCRLHREGALDLSGVAAFLLDEFLGLPRDDPRLFRAQVERELLGRVNLPAERVHVPRSDVDPAEVAGHCAAYERAIADAGGIDLQILGLGRNGHIGFNEPGSERESRTRAVELAPETLEDHAELFGGSERVPRRAITMGVATILAARRIRLLAFGESKAFALARALRGPVDPASPATFLGEHADCLILADEGALRR